MRIKKNDHRHEETASQGGFFTHRENMDGEKGLSINESLTK